MEMAVLSEKEKLAASADPHVHQCQFAAVLVINCRVKMVKYFKNAPAPVRFPHLKIVGEVTSFCYKLTIQKSCSQKNKTKKRAEWAVKWRTPPLW